jgi:hypothetical protein
MESDRDCMRKDCVSRGMQIAEVLRPGVTIAQCNQAIVS